jgi:hypothetical protein
MFHRQFVSHNPVVVFLDIALTASLLLLFKVAPRARLEHNGLTDTACCRTH